MANRQKKARKLEKIPFMKSVVDFERAALAYLKTFPKGKRALNVRLRLGTIYYAHNHFDKALQSLGVLVKEHPRHKSTVTAVEIILDIYSLKNDLNKYQSEGKKFLANPMIANSAYGKQLKIDLEKAKFLVADKFSRSGHSLKAAKAFEKFASMNPRSQQAHSALFNSALNYGKTGSVFESIRMYKRVVAKPGGKAVLSLKQDARNNLGALYKKLGLLKKAAIQYESYGLNARGEKAINALFNAAVIWDALNEYGRAVKAYDAYARLDKKNNKGPKEAAWAKAEMYRRQKSFSKAITEYDKFIRLNSSDKLRMAKAHFYIADSYSKLRKITKAIDGHKKVVRFVDRSARTLGAKYAAESQFRMSRGLLNEMSRVRLGTTEASITTGLNRMKALQKRLINDMAKVIKYDYGPMVVGALSAEARSYEIIGMTFKNIPVPKEYSKGDVRKEFLKMAKGQAEEFIGKAIIAYRNAFDKGLNLKAYGEPMILSAQALYRLDPKGFKDGGEINEIGYIIDMMGVK